MARHKLNAARERRILQEIVVDAHDEAECAREMFVMIRWERDGLGVPLSQLKPLAADEETASAIADWHYWIARGYQ